MPKKKYRVALSTGERDTLRQLVRRGKPSSRKVTRARMLLLAADGSTDEQMVAALKTAFATVERPRKRCVEEGLERLHERPRRGAQRQLTGKQEAHLVAVACSTPPEGQARCTLKWLAGKVGELGMAASITRETVRQGLKKTNSSRGSKRHGAFPTEAPSASPAWQTCGTCMLNRMPSGVQSSGAMKRVNT